MILISERRLEGWQISSSIKRVFQFCQTADTRNQLFRLCIVFLDKTSPSSGTRVMVLETWGFVWITGPAKGSRGVLVHQGRLDTTNTNTLRSSDASNNEADSVDPSNRMPELAIKKFFRLRSICRLGAVLLGYRLVLMVLALGNRVKVLLKVSCLN